MSELALTKFLHNLNFIYFNTLRYLHQICLVIFLKLHRFIY